MIPQLKDKTGNTLIGNLSSAIECLVQEERNGIFELTMIYPINYDIYSSLVEGNIIVADANDTLKAQMFRIYMTRKLMSNRIEVYARHISFDLAYDFIEGLTINNQSCQYALQQIFSKSQFSTGYKAISDIVNTNSMSLSRVNCLEAIAGVKGSIVDTYGTGAEILRDNKTISVLNARGKNNNVTIEYKKNLTGFELEEDTSELVTRIYPYATYTDANSNEITVTIGSKFVDSPLINNYSHQFIKQYDYSNKFQDGAIPTESKLIEYAKREFTINKVDVPKQNFKIEFIPLSKCVGYEGLEDKISLCDTVTIIDTRYNVNTLSKVVKYVYDVLRDRYDNMELGEPRTTLGDIIGGTGESTQGPPGPQGPAGADGNLGDFPDSLPSTPVLNSKVYGFGSIEITWTYESQVYYEYELYASKTNNFTPNSFDLIFKGQASTFLHQVTPGETWYYKCCCVNTFGKRTAFSSQITVTTSKIDDLSNYVSSIAIGDALIGTLSLERGWVGQLKGNWIDAKQLSVTDSNDKRTLWIDSFGNVNLDVASLKINSSNAATQNYADTVGTNATNSANSSTDNKLKNYATTTTTNNLQSQITQNATNISSKVSNSNFSTLFNQNAEGFNFNIGSTSTDVYINKSGITVKNGGLTVKNKSGENVLSADTNGNLTFNGYLYGKDQQIKLIGDTMKIDGRNNAIRLQYDTKNYIYVHSENGGETIFYSTNAYNYSNYPPRIRVDGSGHAVFSGASGLIKLLNNSAYPDLQARNSGDTAYARVAGKEFVQGSKREFKENIDDLDKKMALNILKSNKIRCYNYVDEVETLSNLDSEAKARDIELEYEMITPQIKLGLVIEELTEEAAEVLHAKNSDGISLYSMTSVLWEVTQQQQETIESQQDRISKLEERLARLE